MIESVTNAIVTTSGSKKEIDRRYYLKNKEKCQARIQARKILLRDWLRKYKSNLQCETCGEKDWRCLDFHHNDPLKKEFNLSKAIHLGFSVKRMLLEIDKCSILCSNCHRKEHMPDSYSGETLP